MQQVRRDDLAPRDPRGDQVRGVRSVLLAATASQVLWGRKVCQAAQGQQDRWVTEVHQDWLESKASQDQQDVLAREVAQDPGESLAFQAAQGSRAHQVHLAKACQVRWAREDLKALRALLVQMAWKVPRASVGQEVSQVGG